MPTRSSLPSPSTSASVPWSRPGGTSGSPGSPMPPAQGPTIQLPAMQFRPAEHALLHSPQCAGSVFKSTQTPPHCVSAGPHPPPPVPPPPVPPPPVPPPPVPPPPIDDEVEVSVEVVPLVEAEVSVDDDAPPDPA